MPKKMKMKHINLLHSCKYSVWDSQQWVIWRLWCVVFEQVEHVVKGHVAYTQLKELADKRFEDCRVKSQWFCGVWSLNAFPSLQWEERLLLSERLSEEHDQRSNTPGAADRRPAHLAWFPWQPFTTSRPDVQGHGDRHCLTLCSCHSKSFFQVHMQFDLIVALSGGFADLERFHAHLRPQCIFLGSGCWTHSVTDFGWLGLAVPSHTASYCCKIHKHLIRYLQFV